MKLEISSYQTPLMSPKQIKKPELRKTNVSAAKAKSDRDTAALMKLKTLQREQVKLPSKGIIRQSDSSSQDQIYVGHSRAGPASIIKIPGDNTNRTNQVSTSGDQEESKNASVPFSNTNRSNIEQIKQQYQDQFEVQSQQLSQIQARISNNEQKPVYYPQQSSEHSQLPKYVSQDFMSSQNQPFSSSPMGMTPMQMPLPTQNSGDSQMMQLWNHLMMNQQMHSQQIQQILQFQQQSIANDTTR